MQIVIFALIIFNDTVAAKARFLAENFPQANVVEQIQAIIDHTINQQYDSARQICQHLQKQYPQHPVGFFFEAATLQALMLDDENDESKEGFFALTAKVHKLCKSALRNDPKNSWLYFFMGGALGYEAYFRGREQKYLKAFSDGWNSIQSLETAIALDSSNYDAYLGIGAYKYYRSWLNIHNPYWKLKKFLRMTRTVDP